MEKRNRSAEKRLTPQSRILRYMRLSRGHSMAVAASELNLSKAAVCHIEHGRLDISAARIQQLVRRYDYTMEEFNEYMSGKPLPALSLRDSCIQILGQLDEGKLRAVHGMLVGFA